MRTVKAMAAAFIMAMTFNAPAMAQNMEKASHMKMKKHVCTAACKDGKHVYAHGEKGHVCTAECKKAMKKM